jgi:hypothetical protein
VARPTISTRSSASPPVPVCEFYLADYHLAVRNLAEAERLIHETGYHRRDAELKKLRKLLAGGLTD